MMMLPEPTDVMPTRNPPTSPMTANQARDFALGGFCTARVLNLLLKEQERWNTDQQHSHGNGDEMIDPIAACVAQVYQKTNA